MNSHLTPRLTAGLCSAAIGVLGFAAPAMAQTPASTISIDNCHVQRSPTTHVVWFDCAVTADNATNVSAHYRSNLATWKPKTIGPWSSRSGTVAFKGGGEQIRSLKFAVRNKHLSVRQVEQRVRVTLSNAKGATITDGVATAATRHVDRTWSQTDSLGSEQTKTYTLRLPDSFKRATSPAAIGYSLYPTTGPGFAVSQPIGRIGGSPAALPRRHGAALELQRRPGLGDRQDRPPHARDGARAERSRQRLAVSGGWVGR